MGETKIGEMRVSYGTLSVMKGTYLTEDGLTAIWLDREDGERVAVLSVNLNIPDFDLPADRFFVKTWSENANIVEYARLSGLFIDTGIRVLMTTYNCSAELWEIAE